MTDRVAATAATGSPAAVADRPSPAPALELTFSGILQRQMHHMPMVNPALAVQAVGFKPWAGHWLGVLITPWFMNLWLMPRISAQWQPIGERETRHYVFPAGVFEFIGGRDAVLGDYQACSLFSPMFEFADQASAHDTALAALDALFERANREIGEGGDTGMSGERAARAGEPVAAPAHSPVAKHGVSKRDFLFGSAPRGGHGP